MDFNYETADSKLHIYAGGVWRENNPNGCPDTAASSYANGCAEKGTYKWDMIYWLFMEGAIN